MNNRLRQKIKAIHILDKTDPLMLCSVSNGKNGLDKYRIALIIRKSEYEKTKEMYGDDLEVMC